MDSQIRVGIVGFGGAGMALHTHFLHISGCRVVSICDPEPAAQARVRQLDSTLQVFDDLDAFLGSGIDAVAVASPDRTHADYVVKSLEAGKHILCEKPLADTVEACARILEAERKATGCVAAVQHQMRFLPLHKRIKALTEQNVLGPISYMEGYYVHNLKTRAGKYHNWRFDDNATPLVYSGCHFVDLLMWFAGEPVESVMAMANNISFPEYPESDLNVVLLRFRSGAVGKVITAFGAPRPQDHSVRLYGTKHTVENNLLFDASGHYDILWRPSFRRYRPTTGSPIRRLRRFKNELKHVVFSRLFELLMKGYGVGPGEYSLAAYPLRLYEHEQAVRDSVLDFVRAIRNGKKAGCPLIEAAQAVAVCVAGVESYRTGESVTVSPITETE